LRADAVGALRLLRLLALLDPLLDLHDGRDQALGGGRAAGHVHVHRDDLVDPLHDVVRAVEAPEEAQTPIEITHLGSGIWS